VAYAFFTRPMTAWKSALRQLRKIKELLFVTLLLDAGCAGVPEISEFISVIPAILVPAPLWMRSQHANLAVKESANMNEPSGQFLATVAGRTRHVIK